MNYRELIPSVETNHKRAQKFFTNARTIFSPSTSEITENLFTEGYFFVKGDPVLSTVCEIRVYRHKYGNRYNGKYAYGIWTNYGHFVF